MKRAKPYAVKVVEPNGDESTTYFRDKSNASLHAYCMEDGHNTVTRLVATDYPDVIGWREVSYFLL